ncbi:MAG TPA: tetratricopeptide repeat protein [Chloroflexia bacterium]|nr:tetratricopeptide repeat protein [Chloroflexia bacterium]
MANPNLPAVVLPGPAPGGGPHNLPVQPARLIGREREMAALTTLLRRPAVRLVTLTGAGGTGKTRLAVQVALELLPAFADGVYYIALAPIRDPTLVASTVAEALGLTEAAGQAIGERLRDHLAGKQLLLVLDNFEQILAATPLLVDLLAGAPQLKILVTSRTVLAVAGEQDFAIAGLAVPASDTLPPTILPTIPAVALFIERARTANADFMLTAENAAAVVALCGRLDGLPLALELAAARSNILSPPELLARLGGAEPRSLQLLTGGSGALPARQQTLRAAIAWSYDLLEPAEQLLFRRLAVFVGGWTLKAAEAVAGGQGPDRLLPPLPGTPQPLILLLAALLDKSLLRQSDGDDGVTRFWMLETIREYALERLTASGEEEALRRAHTAYYLALAEAADLEWTGGAQDVWMARLEQEHNNLRATLHWVDDHGDMETALLLTGALWRFWWTRGYLSEGRRWLEDTLARSAGMPATLRAKVLDGAGLLARDQGDLAQSLAWIEQSLALYREIPDVEGVANALDNLGWTRLFQGDELAAAQAGEESLALYRARHNQYGIASALHLLGWIAMSRQDHTQAAAAFTESLALARQLNNRRTVASILNSLGEVARLQEDYGPAALLYRESLALNQEMGSKRGVAMALHNLGYSAHHQGDLPQAAAYFMESLQLFRDLGNKRGIAECLAGLAGLAGAAGQTDRAGRLFGAAEALLQAIGAPLQPADLAEFERNVARAREGGDAATWQAAWAAGRALSVEAAIAYAIQPAPAG